jgi:hypothetical protein
LNPAILIQNQAGKDFLIEILRLLQSTSLHISKKYKAMHLQLLFDPFPLHLVVLPVFSLQLHEWALEAHPGTARQQNNFTGSLASHGGPADLCLGNCGALAC